MPTTNLQQYTNDWTRRTAQFQAAGVPEEVYKMLHQRDAYNVIVKGGSPMTDQDVYTGVQSAIHGPQIQDPQPQHGGHGFLSSITDVIGNVSSDVKGIVFGAGPAIAHTVRHFPSEVTNTVDLVDHLAAGDNTWLRQKGYIGAKDNIHPGWSGFASILRAMNANGSKQLLPMIPGLSDLANMTTRQGRNSLIQHPVGTMLDIWPEAAGAGRLATLGRDFSMAAMAERAGLTGAAADLRAGYETAKQTAIDDVTKNKGEKAGQKAGERAMKREMTSYDPSMMRAMGIPERKFYSAGRALQRGSPLRAGVSAAGDIVPYWGAKDPLTLRNMTVRQKVSMVAAANGLSNPLREGLTRPFEAAKQEANLRLVEEYFGDKMWDKLDPERAMFMWKIAHYVNPETNAPLTVAEHNKWIGTLNEAERAGMTTARDFTEKQRKDAITAGMAEQIKLGDGPHGLFTVLKSSDLWKVYDKRRELAQQLHEAENPPSGNVDLTQVNKLAGALDKANKEFDIAQANYLPDQYKATFMAAMKSGAKTSPGQVLTGQALTDALKVIDSSPRAEDFERLLGKEGYTALKKDAMQLWWRLSEQGAAPLWMHDMSTKDLEASLTPKNLYKEKKPTVFKGKETVVAATTKNFYDFVNGGGTVMDIAAVLNRTQAEMVYAEGVNSFVKGFVLPRAYTLENKTAQFEGSLQYAKTISPKAKLPSVQQAIENNFVPFNSKGLGLNPIKFAQADKASLLLDKDTFEVLKELVKPPPEIMRNKIIRKGTALYKFSVLTGVRHLAHVSVGGFMMMLGGEPLAPLYLYRAHRVITGKASPEDYGLAGVSLTGLKENYYKLGPRHTYQDYGIGPERAWSHSAGQIMGEGWFTQMVHEAKQKGVPLLEYIPNKLSELETHTMTMYKTSVYLSRRARGMEEKMALEGAHKLFVDMNGMSTIERTVVRTIFPFYAFTRHLFRYLGTYPVDYPLRAAIITQFAEQEQKDWKNGLPRSYQMLLMLGAGTNAKGDVTAWDLKNANPFRSFANDFSIAGFTSSLSPFITGPLSIAGFDTLSGTTQLYPGTTFDPLTGTLKATPQPGWGYSLGEAFVPQFGLLDHYLKITDATRFIAATDPAAYRKQLYNMLNMPFMPEVVNVPYEKEITEMRRFRQAQSAVSTAEKNTSPENISQLLTFNAVPFDGQLVPAQTLATYLQRVKQVLAKAHGSDVSVKAVMSTPRGRRPTLASGLAPTTP